MYVIAIHFYTFERKQVLANINYLSFIFLGTWWFKFFLLDKGSAQA